MRKLKLFLLMTSAAIPPAWGSPPNLFPSSNVVGGYGVPEFGIYCMDASNNAQVCSFSGGSGSGGTVTQGTGSSATPWWMEGLGTAGTPAGGVLSVQGVSGGQAVPVSGSVSVSGSLSISNFPSTQSVTGSLSISNFPATQSVTGTVADSVLSGALSAGHLPVNLFGNGGTTVDFALPAATAPTNALEVGCEYLSTGFTLTSGQAAPCAVSVHDWLLTSDQNLVQQGSTTGSLAFGPLEMAAVSSTGTSSFANGQNAPITESPQGYLAVTLNRNAAYQGAFPTPSASAYAGYAPIVDCAYNSTPYAVGSGSTAPDACDQAMARFVDSEGLKASYATSFVLTPAATPTDVFQLCGSSTKTIRIKRVHETAQSSTFGMMTMQLAVRSSADTGGTSTTPTTLKLDSNNAASTATLTLYSANPTTGGTLTGYADIAFLAFGATASPQPYDRSFGTANNQSIVLRGAAQCMAINLNGGAVPSGGSIAAGVEWTEE